MSKNIAIPRIEYAQNAKKWKLMRDVLDVDLVKAAGVDYLPMPDESNDSDANKRRYDDYRKRAQFLGVTARTIQSLVGAIFRRPATADLPAPLQYLAENCDGQGNSLEQFAKTLCTELLTTGRGGVLVDYPAADEGMSAEQVAQLGLAARLAYYPAESIISWRTRTVASQLMLDMVVLSEVREVWRDDFTLESEQVYRVLIMRDGVYAQELYAANGDLIEASQPRQSSGAPWGQIPFAFAGAQRNAVAIDTPPLYGLANLNIGHYRNSADFEEASYICGQPTLFLTSDMSATDFTTANPDGVKIGSRKGHLLGAAGSAVMLQADPNNLPQVGMKDKEAQMLQIGARLVGESMRQETATAARIRAGAEVSALTSLVTNAGEVIEQALEWCADFMGGDAGEVEYQLNTEFFEDQIDPQMIAGLMGLVDARHIAQADLREKLRRGSVLNPSRTDADIDRDIASEGLVLGGDEGMTDG